jgi:hypothetical protein
MRDEDGTFYTGDGELYESFRCEIIDTSEARRPTINLWVAGGEGVHLSPKDAVELAEELWRLADEAGKTA